MMTEIRHLPFDQAVLVRSTNDEQYFAELRDFDLETNFSRINARTKNLCLGTKKSPASWSLSKLTSRRLRSALSSPSPRLTSSRRS